jgi:hypothetical protein
MLAGRIRPAYTRAFARRLPGALEPKLDAGTA